MKFSRAEVERLIIARLSKEVLLIGSFDNTQLFQLLKYQREGHSSNADIITSLLFLLANIPKDHHMIIYPDTDVSVTYNNQLIPAPMGMPDYHLEPPMCANSFRIDSSSSYNSQPDMSGKAVEEYAKRVWFASKLYAQHRYFGKVSESNRHHYQSDASYNAMIQLNLFNKFEACRKRGSNGGPAFYSQAFTYQRRETHIWRGDVKKASVIIPPLSAQNETTNLGAAKVVLTMLRLCGLLVPQRSNGENTRDESKESKESKDSNESEEPELLGMKLGDNWNNRRLILFGDGLSQVRARSFDALIREGSTQFGPQYRMRSMLQKALSRVIHVTGDLHGGNFHFLSAVYAMFYGCLLQPVQTMLGWKRIKGTDVTKCYQLAALLALTVAEVVEKQLFGTFLNCILENDKDKSRLGLIEDAADFCVELTRMFDTWCEGKRGSTTDEHLLMLLNYIKSMHYYRLFRVSVGNGDAVMIEWLYKEFLPIYLINGKFNYFEIVLGMIDTFYGELSKSSDLLHVIRVNRTMPLYEGKDKYNNPMSNWAQDAILENLQKLFHSIPFEQSQHVLTMEKAKRFCKKEYSWNQTKKGRKAKENNEDNSPHNDRGNDMKKTSVPKREKETIAISEFISKLDIVKEVPRRKYSRTNIINILASIESELVDEEAERKQMKRAREMMTEEDIAVSSMVNNIFDEERKKKNGMSHPIKALNEDDDDDNAEDDDNSIASNASMMSADRNKVDDNNNDDSIVSVTGIEHEDDDIAIEEEDDALMNKDEDSVDLAEIGQMDVTIDPLEQSEQVQALYGMNEEVDNDVSGSNSNDIKNGDTVKKEEVVQARVDFNETQLDISVGKGTKKKSIRLAKVNVLAFKNVFKVDRDKLAKLNLSDTRLAANERKDRKRKLAIEVLEEVTGIASDNEDELTKQGFAMFGF